jgi:hypothetical protein
MVIELRYLYFKVNREKNNDYMDIAITPEPPVTKTVPPKEHALTR